MASLTINDLKNELVSHGVELPPSAAKKEEYVLLYEEKISGGEKTKFEFSSDDEEVSIAVGNKISKKKVSRKSAGTNGTTEKNGEIPEQGRLTEENSLVVGDINVAQLTDEQLSAKLKEFNVSVGPIVESTREVYRKKLAVSLRDVMNGDSIDGDVNNKPEEISNVVDETFDEEFKDGEFSADEDDPYQPSLKVRPASPEFQPLPSDDEMSNCSVSTNSTASPPEMEPRSNSRNSVATSLYTSIRQRFTGSSTDSKAADGRYTPTPRRSIHSYKVTESSKETVTKMKDGTVSRDFDYKKTTSTSQDEIGSVRKALRFLPSLFLVLIVVAVGYYVYMKFAILDDILVPTKFWIMEMCSFFHTILHRVFQTIPNQGQDDDENHPTI